MSSFRSTRSGTQPSSNKAASKKQNKKVIPGEAEFLHMIELASFEVNIDPYRGIRTLVAQHHCQSSQQCADRTVPSGNNDSDRKICKTEDNCLKESTLTIEHPISAKLSDRADLEDICKKDDDVIQNDDKSRFIEPTISSRVGETPICASDGSCLQIDCENNRCTGLTDLDGYWRRNCSIVVGGKQASDCNFTSEISEETKEFSSEEWVRLISGSNCPSLIEWTSRAILDHRKKSAKRKRKVVSESIPSSLWCHIGRRDVYNTSKVCPCDYNPFCLVSLGGVMDDILNNWATKFCSTHNNQTTSNSNISSAIVVLDDGDIPTSNDAHKPDTTFYSPETTEQLKMVRKYCTVDSYKIRLYFKSTFKEFTSEESIEEYVNRLRQLHESMVFVNPLMSNQQSRSNATVNQELFLSKPPGIENLGATCYLNTQLQCLAQNIVFVEGIVSWRPVTDDSSNDRMSSVLSLFQDLFLRMTSGPLSVINTLEFSNALGLDHHEQQDPNEFSRLLFDRIHDSFKGSSSNKNLGDLLPRLFQGVMVYETTCLECGTKSRRTEEFMDLNLPIVRPESKNSDQMKGFSSTFPNVDTEVQYCLNQYCTAETLSGENQYLCDFCGCKRDAKRDVAFQTLPPILNVQVGISVWLSLILYHPS
jgi:ubiquitin C-terminal hydrolase